MSDQPTDGGAPIERLGGTAADERMVKTSLLRKLLRRPELGAVAGTVLVFAFFGIVAGDTGMWSARGIVSFLEVAAQLGILASAVALLMIAGEFDLSIGSMVGAAGMVVAISSTELGWPMWTCILLAFAFALSVGFLNGLLVVKTGVPSFVVTLAGLFVLRGATLGLARAITNRTQIPGLRDLSEGDWMVPIFNSEIFQFAFTWMAEEGWIKTFRSGKPEVVGLPVELLWWFGLTALATWILLRTSFGNWIFATGGAKEAARNLGVPVDRVKIILFMASSGAAALFAVVQVMDTGSADTLRGLLKEFEAIIAVVVGGTLLAGGYGSAIGGMFGALIFGTVSLGIFFTGVDSDWFKAFVGVSLLIAVLFNNYIRKRVTQVQQ
jgi:simple sugar transport system permease protein